MEKYVKKILTSRVYDVAEETPLQHARNLTERLSNQVMLKREDMQVVFSFKIRGAYNKIVQLSDEDKAKGVIAASAGNHGQGVAYAARKLNLRAVIVMGRNTPSIKVDAVKNLGARVVLHGDSYDEATAHAQALVRSRGYVYIHPYDDVDVIAGQGTVGMEILNQHPGPPDVIFVPVGGGGLIAGISAYTKYLSPQTRIVGVEAEGSACLTAALAAKRRVKLPFDSLDLFADGVSVAQIGKETFNVAKRCVDQTITVNTDEICAAIKDLFDETRSIAEPSGALAVAGLKKYVARTGVKDKAMVAVVSGANVNFDRLRHISERAEVGEHREVILGVTIPEKKGSFRKFCRAIGKHPVSEFNYRYAGGEEAHVFVGLQVAAAADRSRLIASLQDDYRVEDMTDNEAAKLHVRHMVGGRTFGNTQELLYRFEFPERPGALSRFLAVLGTGWNITLFHYRNHGAAWGRVLVGFEATGKDRTQLTAYLKRIGYRYWEETENPAYELFLR